MLADPNGPPPQEDSYFQDEEMPEEVAAAERAECERNDNVAAESEAESEAFELHLAAECAAAEAVEYLKVEASLYPIVVAPDEGFVPPPVSLAKHWRSDRIDEIARAREAPA